MPNWCYNTLEVSGDETSLQKFYEENKTDEEPLSLNKGITLPENVDELSEEEFKKLLPEDYDISFGERWYNFQCANWGTKWELGDVTYSDNNGSIMYDFHSAWSPPHNWLKTISKKYLDLSFKMISEEGGNDFWCKLVIEEGQIIEDIEEALSTKNMEELMENYDTNEIVGNFLRITKEMEIEDFYDSSEINDMLLEYGIDERDGEWYTIITYFEKVNDIFVEARNKFKIVQEKNKFKKFINFCLKQKLHDNLLEFHTCPPLGDKLLKNGGFLYQETEKIFNNNHSDSLSFLY